MVSYQWLITLFAFCFISLALLPNSLSGSELNNTSLLVQENEISFRGGPERTGVFNSSVPASAQHIWNFSAGDMMQGSVAYWNRMLFFCSYNGLLHAVSAADGSETWNYTINTTLNSIIDSTPYIHERKVYFGASDGYMHCVNADNGSIEWKFNVGRGVISSALVVNDTVIFGARDRRIYAVNISSHIEKWNYSTNGEIWSSPAFYNGRIYIGSLDGKLYALDIDNGQEVWNCTPGIKIPFVDKRAIYATPAIAEGVLYIGFGAENYGGVAAVNASNGKVIWTFGIGGENAGSFYSSCAVHNRTVFAQRNLDPKGKGGNWLYALSAVDKNGDGVINGSSEIFWKFRTGENNGGSSPAIADGCVVVGTSGADPKLYVIDEKTGKQRWNISIENSIYSSPTIAEDKIFIPDTGGIVHVITTGSLPIIQLQIIPDLTSIGANQVIAINFRTSYNNIPIGGATLKIKVSVGKLSQETSTTFLDGSQKVKYWAPDTKQDINATLTVSATAPGFQKSEARVVIKVAKGAESIADSGGFYVNWNKYMTHIGVISILVALIVVILILTWNMKRRSIKQ